VNRGRITRAATSLPLHCARSDAERGGELADPSVALFQRLPDRGIGRRGDGRPTERLALGASPLQARLHARKMGLEGIDTLDRLGRDRGLVEPRQIEELASSMRPTGSLDNWPRFALGLVQPVRTDDRMSIQKAAIGLRQAQASTGSGFDRLSRPPVDARFVVASASRCLRAKAHRNIPSGESDESSIEVIWVRDPRHPLFGRSFRVIRRTIDRGGNFPASYEVEYRNGSSLLIPVRATEQYDLNSNQTKLSIEALLDLVSAAECIESNEYRSRTSLVSAVADAAASNRRRRRCRAGGGRS
jgi:hypothetical protein